MQSYYPFNTWTRKMLANHVFWLFCTHLLLLLQLSVPWSSRVRIPLKPWFFFFQASSFQLLKLENSLRWSFFTFIYNRSSNTNYLIYLTSLFSQFDCYVRHNCVIGGHVEPLAWPLSSFYAINRPYFWRRLFIRATRATFSCANKGFCYWSLSGISVFERKTN